MREWLAQNTNGNFTENYIDQSWDDFCEKHLKPVGRDLYEFGTNAGNPIPTFAAERYVCVTRK